MYVASHHKDNIECAIQKRLGHRQTKRRRVIEAAYLMLDMQKERKGWKGADCAAALRAGQSDRKKTANEVCRALYSGERCAFQTMH